MVLGQYETLWFPTVAISDFNWKACLFVNEEKWEHDSPRYGWAGLVKKKTVWEACKCIEWTRSTDEGGQGKKEKEQERSQELGDQEHQENQKGM